MRDKVIADIIDEWRSLSAVDFLPSHGVEPNDLPKAAAALALAGVPRYAKAGWPELFWPWRKPRFRPAHRATISCAPAHSLSPRSSNSTRRAIDRRFPIPWPGPKPRF